MEYSGPTDIVKDLNMVNDQLLLHFAFNPQDRDGVGLTKDESIMYDEFVKKNGSHYGSNLPSEMYTIFEKIERMDTYDIIEMIASDNMGSLEGSINMDKLGIRNLKDKIVPRKDTIRDHVDDIEDGLKSYVRGIMEESGYMPANVLYSKLFGGMKGSYVYLMDKVAKKAGMRRTAILDRNEEPVFYYALPVVDDLDIRKSVK